jgi:hypothetical protein
LYAKGLVTDEVRAPTACHTDTRRKYATISAQSIGL